MSKINFQQVAPTVAQMNPMAFLAGAKDSYASAYKTLQDTLGGVQTSIRDTNTAKLEDYLRTAKDARQFNSASFQGDYDALRSTLGNEYNKQDMRKLMQEMPGQLQARTLNDINITNGENALADNVTFNDGLKQYIVDRDISKLAGIVGNFKGNAAPLISLTDGLQNSQQQREASQHGMKIAAGGLQLSQDQFAYTKQKDAEDRKRQQAALEEMKTAALGGGGGAPGTVKGHSVNTPSQWDNLIGASARKYGVSSTLVKAIMQQESGGSNGQYSEVGAGGLMQLMPGTAERYGLNANNRMDPAANIEAASRYIADLNKMFKGDTQKVATAFFAGEGNVKKWSDMGSAQGKSWIDMMMRPGKDGKNSNPKSTQYLRDISARLGGLKEQAAIDAKNLKSGNMSVADAGLYIDVSKFKASRPGVTPNDLKAGRVAPMTATGNLPIAAANTAANPWGAAGSMGTADNYQSLMQLAGNSDNLKSMFTLQSNLNKLAGQSEKELIQTQLKNSGISKNLGAYAGSYEAWKKENTGVFTGAGRDSYRAVTALEKNPSFNKMDDTYKTAVVQTLLTEVGARNLNTTEATQLGTKLIEDYTSKRIQSDQLDAQMYNDQYQQSVMLQQLVNQEDAMKKYQDYLRNLSR